MKKTLHVGDKLGLIDYGDPPKHNKVPEWGMKSVLYWDKKKHWCAKSLFYEQSGRPWDGYKGLIPDGRGWMRTNGYFWSVVADGDEKTQRELFKLLPE